MQLTYRIPSKKVPYGFLEFTMSEGESLPDPVALAEQYAQYIKDYQAAEVQAFENPTIRQIQKTDNSVDEARKILEDGIGETTEVNENDPPAPWDKPAEASEPAPAKAWEADESDWDFG